MTSCGDKTRTYDLQVMTIAGLAPVCVRIRMGDRRHSAHPISKLFPPITALAWKEASRGKVN